jgi:hypothetical protein
MSTASWLDRVKEDTNKTLPWIVVGVSSVASVAILIDHHELGDFICRWLGSDLFKIVAQYLFVTMLGGIVFFLLKMLGEEAGKRELRQAAKRDLAKETDGLYRAVKHVKRMLRTQMRVDGNEIRIPKEKFDKQIEELDKLQISIEQAAEAVKARSDLVSVEVLNRIYKAVRYAARYIHDVLEEYEQGRKPEQGKVRIDGEFCVIGENCNMMQDFLLGVPLSPKVKAQLKIIEGRENELEPRWQAFLTIEEQTPRYRVVAQECFAMAVRELVNSATR